MLKLQGIGVSPGIAISEAFVMGHEGFRIPRHFIREHAIANELARLQSALEASAIEIASNRDTVSKELGQKYGDIFEAQFQIISDPKLHEEFFSLIEEKTHSAEYAVSVTIRRYADVFKRLDSSYMAERVNDILDIEKRLLRHLLGIQREALSSLTAPVIVLAANLTPSETAKLNRQHVKGFVTEIGGAGGHTAIVAAALEIPAVVGVGSFLGKVSGGDFVIVDGESGTVIIRPDVQTLDQYRERSEKTISQARILDELKDEPAITTDGVRIKLMGNIEFPYETQHCLDRGADGIGLYRTEFLFLAHGGKSLPTEEEHFEAYRSVAESMQGRPITIRTYDLGSDKLPSEFQYEIEKNPQLGLRSIRLSLRNVQIFRDQLRAILRASAFGKIQVMFPLVSTLLELRQSKMIFDDLKDEMYESGIDFDRHIRVGMMIEVPSAAIRINSFIKEVDFVSIGTNDLVQYTLAVDRTNKDVAHMYHSEDPAVLLLVKQTIDAANKHNVPVSLCGQMGSSPLYVKLLIGMGLRELSCSPNFLPELKQTIRNSSIAECEEISRRVLEMDNDRDIRVFLRNAKYSD